MPEFPKAPSPTAPHPRVWPARGWLAPAWWLRRWRAWRHTPALVHALATGDSDAAIAALGRGADACVRAPGRNCIVTCLEPALVLAASANDRPLVQALLDHGADIEDRRTEPNGQSALAVAVLARSWDAAQLLSDAGASWDTPVSFISADGMAAGMFLGGLDPRRVRHDESTLAALVTGQDQDVGNYYKNQSTWLHDQPQVRQIHARAQASRRTQALHERLPLSLDTASARARL